MNLVTCVCVCVRASERACVCVALKIFMSILKFETVEITKL